MSDAKCNYYNDIKKEADELLEEMGAEILRIIDEHLTEDEGAILEAIESKLDLDKCLFDETDGLAFQIMHYSSGRDCWSEFEASARIVSVSDNVPDCYDDDTFAELVIKDGLVMALLNMAYDTVREDLTLYVLEGIEEMIREAKKTTS